MLGNSKNVGIGVTALRARQDLPHGVFATLLISGEQDQYDPNLVRLHADAHCQDLFRPKYDSSTSTAGMNMTSCSDCITSHKARTAHPVRSATWEAWMRTAAAFGATVDSDALLQACEAAMSDNVWTTGVYRTVANDAAKILTTALRHSQHPCVPGPPEHDGHLDTLLDRARGAVERLDALDAVAAAEVRTVLEVAEAAAEPLARRWTRVSGQWSYTLASKWALEDIAGHASDQQSQRCLFVVPVSAGRHMMWLDDEEHTIGHAVLASTTVVASSDRHVLLDLTQAQAGVIIEMVHGGTLEVEPYPASGVDPVAATVALSMVTAQPRRSRIRDAATGSVNPQPSWSQAYQAAQLSLAPAAS